MSAPVLARKAGVRRAQLPRLAGGHPGRKGGGVDARRGEQAVGGQQLADLTGHPYAGGDEHDSLTDSIGNFTGNGDSSALAINTGAHSFALLPGIGAAGFLNPVVTGALGYSPAAIAAGAFDLANNALTDFAVLDAARSQCYNGCA